MSQSRRKGSESLNIPLKACLFASEHVCKAELLEKYIAQEKVSDKINMMGFIVKTIQHNSQNIKLNIWDVATQERYLISSSLILKDCDIILCMFDYTNPDSFSFLKEKYTFLKTNSKTDVVFGLIGLNYQLDSNINQLQNEITSYATKLKAYFVATNVKLEMNYKEAFEKGVDLALAMKNIQVAKVEAEKNLKKDEIEINDITLVKHYLETNLLEMTNGLIGKMFGGDKEKIKLYKLNLKIVAAFEKSNEALTQLKEKNQTLEKAIGVQYLKTNTDELHKNEIAELEKRLNDTIINYTKQINTIDYELRASRALCDALKSEVLKLEEKNEKAAEGFKTVLQTYRSQTKEKIESKDKIISELQAEKEVLKNHVNQTQLNKHELKMADSQEKSQQDKMPSEIEFLSAELAKKDQEISELKKRLEEKERNHNI